MKIVKEQLYEYQIKDYDSNRVVIIYAYPEVAEAINNMFQKYTSDLSISKVNT